MNDYNYFLFERLAEQRHAEMLAAAEAELLARVVAGESGHAPRRNERGRRLAYAAVAVFLLIVAQLVAAATL